jgi:hypothetical protein
MSSNRLKVSCYAKNEGKNHTLSFCLVYHASILNNKEIIRTQVLIAGGEGSLTFSQLARTLLRMTLTLSSCTTSPQVLCEWRMQNFNQAVQVIYQVLDSNIRKLTNSDRFRHVYIRKLYIPIPYSV